MESLKKRLASSLASLSHFKPLLYNSLVIKILAADSLSEIGNRITYFALIKKVYDISGGSILDLGFLTIAQVLPFIIMGPFAGVLADRISRRTLLISTDICGAIAVLTLLVVDTLPAIVVVAILTSTICAFRTPAKKAIEPNLIAPDQIAIFNSLKSFVYSFLYVAGFSLGASIVAFLGVTMAFWVDSATFFLSAAIISSMKVSEGHIKNIPTADKAASSSILSACLNFKSEVAVGLRIVRDSATLKLLLILEMALSFLFSAQSVLIYSFIRESLQAGDKSELLWGFVMSSRGVGSIAGSILIGILVKKTKNRFKIFLNILLWDGFILAGFALNSYVPVAIFTSFFLGIICAAPVILLCTILQESVSDENRGKVSSFITAVDSPLSIISIFMGTAMANVITAQGSLLIFSFLEIMTVALIFISSLYKNAKRDLNKQETTDNAGIGYPIKEVSVL